MRMIVYAVLHVGATGLMLLSILLSLYGSVGSFGLGLLCINDGCLSVRSVFFLNATGDTIEDAEATAYCPDAAGW